MSKSTKQPPFDPLDAAVDVRSGKRRLEAFTPEQQSQIRQKLRHTGTLRTELLRRDVNKHLGRSSGETTVSERTSYPGGVYGG